MKIITQPTRVPSLPQGSPEWHAFRKMHCPASEAGAVLGCSPFIPRNPQQLSEVRAGIRKVFISDAMNYGHKHEPEVRDYLEKTYMELIEPQVWRMDVEVCGIELPLSCSVDGLDMNGVVYEIKCPASPTSETVTLAKAGKVSSYYTAQVQQQMLVVGAKEACFAVRDPEDGAIYTVWLTSDPVYQENLLQEWSNIWPFLKVGATLSKPQGDMEFDALCEEYIAAKEAADVAERELDGVRGRLIASAIDSGGKELASDYYGLSVTKAERAGNVNYKSIPELKGVDLDKYRGKPTEFWTVRVTNSKEKKA